MMGFAALYPSYDAASVDTGLTIYNFCGLLGPFPNPEGPVIPSETLTRREVCCRLAARLFHVSDERLTSYGNPNTATIAEGW
jgi:hypothetical protein